MITIVIEDSELLDKAQAALLEHNPNLKITQASVEDTDGGGFVESRTNHSGKVADVFFGADGNTSDICRAPAGALQISMCGIRVIAEVQLLCI